MFYKTKQDTETGRKLQQLFVQKFEIDHAVKVFVDKVGGSQYLVDSSYAAGGIRALDKVSNMTGWKRSKKSEHKGGYVPDRKTKEGKELYQEMSELPRLDGREFNLAVGFSSIFSRIGCFFDSSSGFYFLEVSTSKYDNEYQPPADCIEIVESEYRKAAKMNL